MPRANAPGRREDSGKREKERPLGTRHKGGSDARGGGAVFLAVVRDLGLVRGELGAQALLFLLGGVGG